MSKTIGVMIGNANSPYTIDTLNGIREAAVQLGVNIICFTGIHSTYFYKEYLANEIKEDFDYQSTCVFDYDKLCKLDGLIVAYGSLSVFMTEKELYDFQRRISGIPTVYLENIIEGREIRYITEDNYSGMRIIMDHMINYHGYEKILYLSGPLGNYDAEERLRGYKEAMSEAGISYDDSMIEYGDFSENIEPQVNRLLDLHPDADAVVFANDTMAIASYRVFDERKKLYYKALKNGDREGIEKYIKHIVGEASEHGIAISGYDNIPDSMNIEPQLTTIVQSPHSHGMMAVHTILNFLYEKSNPENITAVPKPIFRKSCGCQHTTQVEFPELDERFKTFPEQYAATTAQIFTNAILPVEDINNDASEEIYGMIYEIVLKNVKKYLGISGKKLTSEELLEDTKRFLSSSVSICVPKLLLVSTFHNFMINILKNAKQVKDRETLIDAEAKISDYVYTKLFADTREELALYRHRTWFMPLILRDMASSLDSKREMYYNAIAKIKALELGDVYLFVSEDTIVHKKNEKWECPKELRLVASTVDGKISAYDPDEAPIVSRENVINNYISSGDDSYFATVLNLYSGEYQYGIIVAKISTEDVLSLYCSAVQISTALKYCEMAREQERVRKELTQIIKEVEERM